jgi:hypothetical protein
MTCKVNADTTNGLKLTSDTSGEIDLQTNGTTKVHMASDGKVGIGTTSPAQMLHVKASDARIRTEESSGSTTFEMTNTSSGHFLDSSGTNNLTINKIGAGDMLFKASNAERFRMLANGKICFGSTTAESTSEDNMQIDPSGGNIYMYQNTTALQGVIDFRNPNGYIGSIRTTGSSTQFNTSSDYRLKENIDYTFDATTELKRLKPCKFNFKADTDTTVEGFIAHEVAEVVPHAISGEKDATDDEDNPIYQQIDQSKLVPLLVKTIQELEARITALENN